MTKLKNFIELQQWLKTKKLLILTTTTGHQLFLNRAAFERWADKHQLRERSCTDDSGDTLTLTWEQYYNSTTIEQDMLQYHQVRSECMNLFDLIAAVIAPKNNHPQPC